MVPASSVSTELFRPQYSSADAPCLHCGSAKPRIYPLRNRSWAVCPLCRAAEVVPGTRNGVGYTAVPLLSSIHTAFRKRFQSWPVPPPLLQCFGISFRRDDTMRETFYNDFLGFGTLAEARKVLRARHLYLRSRLPEEIDSAAGSLVFPLGPLPGFITGFAFLNRTGFQVLDLDCFRDLGDPLIWMRIRPQGELHRYSFIPDACREAYRYVMFDLGVDIVSNPAL